MKLKWFLKDWDELSKDELYEMLALRIEVFVIEQNCPYQDIDGKDRKSLHLFVLNTEGKCMACLRLVKPGVSYDEWSIGRVVTSPEVRSTGLGKQLMTKAMEFISSISDPPVRISAQSHLQKFYEDFHFKRALDQNGAEKEEYMEDDIPHVQMLFKK